MKSGTRTLFFRLNASIGKAGTELVPRHSVRKRWFDALPLLPYASTVKLRFDAERNTIGERSNEVLVRENQSTIRATRGMQLPLIAPPHLPRAVMPFAKGVVYTKHWVVQLLMDL